MLDVLYTRFDTQENYLRTVDTRFDVRKGGVRLVEGSVLAF